MTFKPPLVNFRENLSHDRHAETAKDEWPDPESPDLLCRRLVCSPLLALISFSSKIDRIFIAAIPGTTDGADGNCRQPLLLSVLIGFELCVIRSDPRRPDSVPVLLSYSEPRPDTLSG